jgi:hypothetical protein
VKAQRRYASPPTSPPEQVRYPQRNAILSEALLHRSLLSRRGFRAGRRILPAERPDFDAGSPVSDKDPSVARGPWT